MADSRILTSLSIGSQIPLDSKVYFKTISEMKSLGPGDAYAFSYYSGMIANCIEDENFYRWREAKTPSEVGMIDQHFQYPGGSISNGIDYSGKKYNFFQINLGGGNTGQDIHNLLQGLQGGDGGLDPTEFYHLTELQLQGLIAMIENAGHPIYVAPTSSINLISRILEVGSSNVRTIKNTFIRNDAGPLISERILKNDIQVSATGTYNETGVVPIGDTKYKSESTYEQGPIKTNAVNIPDPIGRIEAGTITSPEGIITGILPWFWKTFDTLPNISTLDISTFTKVISNSMEIVTMPMNIVGKHVVVVIPATSTIKTKWKITELNGGNIGIGNLILSPVGKTLSSPSGFWGPKGFNVYTTAYPTSIEPALELRNN